MGLRGESNSRPGIHSPLYYHYTTKATKTIVVRCTINLNKSSSFLNENPPLDLLLSKKLHYHMKGKGWFIAMAITVALVWTGVNYLFPFK